MSRADATMKNKGEAFGCLVVIGITVALLGTPPAVAEEVRQTTPASGTVPLLGPGTAEEGVEGTPGARYRLRAGDVVELNFPFVPAFNQTLTVQPDGYL